MKRGQAKCFQENEPEIPYPLQRLCGSPATVLFTTLSQVPSHWVFAQPWEGTGGWREEGEEQMQGERRTEGRGGKRCQERGGWREEGEDKMQGDRRTEGRGGKRETEVERREDGGKDGRRTKDGGRDERGMKGKTGVICPFDSQAIRGSRRLRDTQKTVRMLVTEPEPGTGLLTPAPMFPHPAPSPPLSQP